MIDKLLKKTTLFSVGFFTVSMCAILYLSMNKSIEISNVAQDEVVMGDAAGSGDSSSAGKTAGNTTRDKSGSVNSDGSQVTSIPVNSLIFDETGVYSEYLGIPLPEETDPEGIVIENHYMDSELCIFLSGVDGEFYKTNKVTGNHGNILDGSFETTEEGTRLCLNMNGIYEYKTVFENGELYITFMNPHEVYEKIVVIDPACGGAMTGCKVDEIMEKDITLSVAKKLKDLLDSSDIKAYYTRMDDVNPTEEKRIRLANETKADMYIELCADSTKDQYVYGVSAKYNDEYFIPGFGNVELADTMEYETVSAIKGKALGLFEASSEDYTLKKSTVPATSISLGYVSNRQEVQLLSREDYVEKIAQGLFNGINKAYEKMQ